MQTKALGPRWPRAHDVVAMLAIAGVVVTEQARPLHDLDLIDAWSRAGEVGRLHDVGGLHRRPRMCCNFRKAEKARLIESSVGAGLAMTFHPRRLLGPLGDIPPAEFEAQYYAQAAVA